MTGFVVAVLNVKFQVDLSEKQECDRKMSAALIKPQPSKTSESLLPQEVNVSENLPPAFEVLY